MRFVVALALLLLIGCSQPSLDPQDEVRGAGLEIEGSTARHEEGFLSVPVRIANRRERLVEVVVPRAVVEAPSGRRFHVASFGSRPYTLEVGPGEKVDATLTVHAPRLAAFRVYFWIEDSGQIVEGVPPLVFGQGKFQKPERPFTRDAKLPLPTDEPSLCPTCSEPLGPDGRCLRCSK